MIDPQSQLFGSTLRSFRKQACLSQFDLAIALGWKGTTPIVLMEQGKRLPRPETLASVCDALRVGYADRCYLAGLAGYGYETALPPLDQIIAVLDQIDLEIRALSYPAYVIDYRFRCWLANAAAGMFVDGDLERLATMAAQGVTIFDLIFNSELPPHRYSANREQIETEHIFRFKAYNLFRRHEPFYVAYPEVMRDRLLPKDYERFAAKWAGVDAVTMWRMFPRFVPIEVCAGEQTLSFTMVEQPALHLQSMFIAVAYEPTDTPPNLALADAVLGRLVSAAQPCVRAWELPGVENWDRHPLTAPRPAGG